MKERPEVMTEEHTDFLYALRESGVTNMFAAPSYLVEEFPELSKKDARDIFSYWAENFEEPE